MKSRADKDLQVALNLLGDAVQSPEGPYRFETEDIKAEIRWIAKCHNSENTIDENSKHFVGGGTRLIVWVGAAMPTGEMRC
jgi:hypothetical protein